MQDLGDRLAKGQKLNSLKKQEVKAKGQIHPTEEKQILFLSGIKGNTQMFDKLNELNAQVQALSLALKQYTEIATDPKRRAIKTELERGYALGVEHISEQLTPKIDETLRLVKELLKEVTR